MQFGNGGEECQGELSDVQIGLVDQCRKFRSDLVNANYIIFSLYYAENYITEKDTNVTFPNSRIKYKKYLVKQVCSQS